MNRKGSLSLSVNAIVIFVLAFAMLGFGLFVINMLQNQVGTIVPDIFDRDSWDTVPSSENQIVIKGALNFKSGSENVIGIGYYNTDDSPVDVEFSGPLECLPELDDGEDGIELVVLEQTVASRSWEPFKVGLNVGKNVEEKTYICNIKIEDQTIQESIIIKG